MDQVVDRFYRARTRTDEGSRHPHSGGRELTCRIWVADPQLGPVPSEDHYFLAAWIWARRSIARDYLKEQDKGMQTRLMGGFNKLFKVEYQPIGFSWMVYADRTDFDRSHYEFHYIRREFLGECAAWCSTSHPRKLRQRALPRRLWVEDQEYNIVRLNGTYYPAPRNSYFFHWIAGAST